MCSALFCRCVARPAALESEPQEAVAAAKAEGSEVLEFSVVFSGFGVVEGFLGVRGLGV